MSLSRIGSKAKGNDDVQRAAKARKGSFCERKSLRWMPVASGVAYLKWKTLRWRRSKTTVSDRRSGKSVPSMSVVVMKRSSSSMYGDAKLVLLFLRFSIPCRALRSLKYMRRLLSNDCGGCWFVRCRPATDRLSLMSRPMSPSVTHSFFNSSRSWSLARALAR